MAELSVPWLNELSRWLSVDYDGLQLLRGNHVQLLIHISSCLVTVVPGSGYPAAEIWQFSPHEHMASLSALSTMTACTHVATPDTFLHMAKAQWNDDRQRLFPLVPVNTLR
ncbi:hypothetical protein PMIN03_005866 [Paraphaeosphaeria minitans]